MNWFIRFGNWWESRRKVSKVDFEKFVASSKMTNAAIEIQGIKIRLERIELLVGLKREPVAMHIEGEAKIR